ncbi:NADH dehydrogenase [ubiquinone] 1 beta subcomplex subunit [Dirofilaria immitis]
MGNQYHKPIASNDDEIEPYTRQKGDSPYTRSGLPPPSIIQKSDKVPHLKHEPMSLELHMADERARAAGLTPAEREWRKKWVLDQHLHPDEPIHVDAVHRQLNPIRVLYRTPMDKLYKHFLKPTFGIFYGSMIRAIVPKLFMAWILIEASYYYWKYEARGWETLRGNERSYPRERFWDDQELRKKHPDLFKTGRPIQPEHKFEPPSFTQRTALLDLGPPARPCN